MVRRYFSSSEEGVISLEVSGDDDGTAPMRGDQERAAIESVVMLVGTWRRLASRHIEDIANRRPSRELSLSDPGADTSDLEGAVMVAAAVVLEGVVDPFDSSMAQVVQIPANTYSTGGSGEAVLAAGDWRSS